VTLARDGTLVALGAEPLATRHGTFVVHRFHNCTTGAPALAAALGDVRAAAPLPARVHSSCVTSEAYGACDCDCAEQLDGALGHMAAHGRGVLFYLFQEGRGAGFVAKALDRMLVQASGSRLTTFDAYARLGLPDDQRAYGEVARMARLLGITAPLRLLSNNPEKVAALRAAGATIDGTEPIRVAPSPYSQHYLDAKARAGHTVDPPRDVDPAVPPEPVTAIAPAPLAHAPRFVRLASYLVPIGAARPAWFRLHAYLDAAARRERVVLTHGDDGGEVLVRLQRDTLLDRFPVREPRHRRSWDAAAARIADAGSGAVCFADADDDVRDVVGPLLAAHVGTRRARPLVAANEPADGALLADALGRAGVDVGAPVALEVA
jgi:3,4-dihydroxy 2-butanone 4-phosphate synthase / GTP cyclohydrolase II